MKHLPIVALGLFLVLFLFASPAVADPVDSPLPGPTDDITDDFEALPDLYGLGAVVALVVVLVRRFGLPDGWGGYAAYVVGVAAYVALKLLPADAAEQVFEFAAHVAQAALVIIGSQVTHASLKHARLDRLWKGKG